MEWHVSITENHSFQNLVYYVGKQFEKKVSKGLNDSFNFISFNNLLELEVHIGQLNILSMPEILIMEVDYKGKVFEVIERLKQNFSTCGLIIVLISPKLDNDGRRRAKALKIGDFYEHPFEIEQINERLQFLRKFKLIRQDVSQLNQVLPKPYRISLMKRTFDICFSLVCLLLLSPLFIIIPILILLDSPGPIFYKSQRAGTGYKVFDFYKFRSMRMNADKELDKLSGLNQYANGNKIDFPAAFIKLKQDPRVTKLGHFLRNTSIDELPQLFNVLKGDMSIVGNRPLPLYEAKMLTSNEWCQRFLGPAGITGLWQVTKRGKSEMSDRERRELDNYYIEHYSLWFDLKIIGSTIPALLQKEKV